MPLRHVSRKAKCAAITGNSVTGFYSTGGAVDTNVFPDALISRVDIVTGGGREDALRKGGGGLSQREDGDGRQEYRAKGIFRGHSTALPYRVGVPPCSSRLINRILPNC